MHTFSVLHDEEINEKQTRSRRQAKQRKSKNFISSEHISPVSVSSSTELNACAWKIHCIGVKQPWFLAVSVLSQGITFSGKNVYKRSEAEEEMR
jgi:hypothetical protein